MNPYYPHEPRGLYGPSSLQGATIFQNNRWYIINSRTKNSLGRYTKEDLDKSLNFIICSQIVYKLLVKIRGLSKFSKITNSKARFL